MLPCLPRLLFLAVLPLLLTACGGGGSSLPGVRSTSAIRVPPTHPERTEPEWKPARAMKLPGLEGVIGADAAALKSQFGAPRLDVWEGDAHKLQFAGRPCVLDIYLYPARPGGEARATYVDARRESDGMDVDRAACVAALRQP